MLLLKGLLDIAPHIEWISLNDLCTRLTDFAFNQAPVEESVRPAYEATLAGIMFMVSFHLADPFISSSLLF